MRKKIEEQAQSLKEKREQCTQLETSVKENKDKLLASEQRIEQLQSLNKVWVDNFNTFNLIIDCYGWLKHSFSLYKMSEVTKDSFLYW